MYRSDNFPINELSRKGIIKNCEFLIDRHNRLCEIEDFMVKDYVLNKYVHGAADSDYKIIHKDKSKLYVALVGISHKLYDVENFEDRTGFTITKFIEEFDRLRCENNRLKTLLDEIHDKSNNE